MEWRYLVVDRDGFYSPKNRYTRNIHVETTTQSGIINNRYELKRCFPTILPENDLNQATEEVLRYKIELSVDEIELTGLDNISWKRNQTI